MTNKENLLEILVQNQQDDIMLDSIEQENFIQHQNQNINCIEQPNYAATAANNFIFYNSLNDLHASFNDQKKMAFPGCLEILGTT